MTMPRFDNTWTFGNTITIVAMFLGLIGLWNEINTEVARQASMLQQKSEVIEELKMGAAAREARIRALELGAGRTEEKLLSILAYLDRIEKSLGE